MRILREVRKLIDESDQVLKIVSKHWELSSVCFSTSVYRNIYIASFLNLYTIVLYCIVSAIMWHCDLSISMPDPAVGVEQCMGTLFVHCCQCYQAVYFVLASVGSNLHWLCVKTFDIARGLWVYLNQNLYLIKLVFFNQNLFLFQLDWIVFAGG